MNLSVNDILLKMLKSIDIFKDVPDDKLLELSNSSKLEFYQEWSRLIIEWSKPEYIYVLKSWKLEARKANWLSSKVLWTIWDWEIFWEMSYLKWTEAMASVVAIQDSDVRQIPVDAFDSFLKSYPNIMDIIYSTMQKRNDSNKSFFN